VQENAGSVTESKAENSIKPITRQQIR